MISLVLLTASVALMVVATMRILKLTDAKQRTRVQVAIVVIWIASMGIDTGLRQIL